MGKGAREREGERGGQGGEQAGDRKVRAHSLLDSGSPISTMLPTQLNLNPPTRQFATV